MSTQDIIVTVPPDVRNVMVHLERSGNDNDNLIALHVKIISAQDDLRNPLLSIDCRDDPMSEEESIRSISSQLMKCGFSQTDTADNPENDTQHIVHFTR